MATVHDFARRRAEFEKNRDLRHLYGKEVPEDLDIFPIDSQNRILKLVDVLNRKKLVN
jgi:hypothetical protein